MLLRIVDKWSRCVFKILSCKIEDSHIGLRNSFNNFLFERVDHKLKFTNLVVKKTSSFMPFECKTFLHPIAKPPGQFPLILSRTFPRTNPPDIFCERAETLS